MVLNGHQNLNSGPSAPNRRPQPIMGPLQPLLTTSPANWAFQFTTGYQPIHASSAGGLQPMHASATMQQSQPSTTDPTSLLGSHIGLNPMKTSSSGLLHASPSAMNGHPGPSSGLPNLPLSSGLHTIQSSPTALLAINGSPMAVLGSSGALTLLGSSSGNLSHLGSSSRVPVLHPNTTTLTGSQTTFQAIPGPQTSLQPLHYQPNTPHHPFHVRSASYPAHYYYPHFSQTGNSQPTPLGHRASSAGVVSRFSLHSQPTQPVNKVNYPVTPLPHPLQVPEQKLALLKNLIYPHLAVRKYSTAAIDPQRNYLVVFEYPVNGHWVIWDYETGYVHLTGIWKASLREAPPATVSASKADIVKLLDSTPKQFHPYIKRIRGGFLKIQGTWLPYKLCRVLARRFCYPIRHELVPIFGADFPSYCLRPEDPGYGELKLNDVLEDNSILTTGEIKLNSLQMMLETARKRRKRSLPDPRPILALPTPPLLLELPEMVLRNSVSMASNNTLSRPDLRPLAGHAIPNTQRAKRNVESLDITTPILELLLAAIGLFLVPQNPISGPKKLSHKHLQLLPQDMSQLDITDILNASKCLQSLSGSALASLQTSPIAAETPKDENSANYITASPKQVLETEEKSGISSILLAASVSEQPKKDRRMTLKINNLLS